MSSSASSDCPKELGRLLVSGLSFDEIIVLSYLMSEWSVGELLIFKELNTVLDRQRCLKVLRSLVDRGLVKHVSGCCFNINAKAVSELLGRDVKDVRAVGRRLLKFLRKWYDIPLTVVSYVI